MKQDWWSCDGTGELESRPGQHLNSLPSSFESGGESAISRRALLLGASLSSLWWVSNKSALANFSIDKSNLNKKRDTFVVIFLRGGMDGLNTIVPYREDEYYKLRPTLSIASPHSHKAESGEKLIDLDGFFGLNPALSSLVPSYKEGQMAVIHGVGSGDLSRSHFEAMSLMERGLGDVLARSSSGWLARYLNLDEGDKLSPLRAVAFGTVMPDSLRGYLKATNLQSLAEYRIHAASATFEAEFQRALSELYSMSKDEVHQAGLETLKVVESLNSLDPENYKPDHHVVYPNSELGNGLKQTAFLIKSQVGLEVACLDKGGWDTHVAQGSTSGWLTLLLDDLGKSIAAFIKDLGNKMDRVTVIVQTEFGRRAYENQGLGTDHGRASVMFAFGGGVKGGKVYAAWPGLQKDQLDDGDLKVTTDYRNVLAELLTKRAGLKQPEMIFPGIKIKTLGLTKSG